MAINKVIYGDETLIDLTSDTVAPNKVLAGATFHSANGSSSVGTLVTRPVKDTTLADYENDLEDADEGDLLIITDSDGALGTNVINTTDADFDDAVETALEGDFIISVSTDNKFKLYQKVEGEAHPLGISSADLTSYDNSTSGLSATNVQDAVDEINSNIGDVEYLPNPLTTTNENIAQLNSNLTDISLRYNAETELPEWKQRGADTWNPFKRGNILIFYLHFGLVGGAYIDWETKIVFDYDASELKHSEVITMIGTRSTHSDLSFQEGSPFIRNINMADGKITFDAYMRVYRPYTNYWFRNAITIDNIYTDNPTISVVDTSSSDNPSSWGITVNTKSISYRA